MEFMQRHRGFILQMIDVLIWGMGVLAAVLLTTDTLSDSPPHIVALTVVIIAGHIIVYQFLRMYQIIWRYAGIRQVLKCIECEVIVYLLACLAANLLFHWPNVRFSMVAFLCTATLMVSSRMVYGLLVNWSRENHGAGRGAGVRTLIVGAGESARILLEDMKRSERRIYNLVGVLDDDPAKQGRRLSNVRVYGPIDELARFVEQLDVETIIFAISRIEDERRRQLLRLCTSTGKRVMMAPSPQELRRLGKGASERLLHVDINNLLGRDLVLLDNKAATELVHGRRVLVTGGGGSIGGELCRQIAGMFPEQLVIVDIYENGAYEIQQELYRSYGDRLNLSVEILSVCDRMQMERVFRNHQPELVFHAAAHKHVPLMETVPEEAIHNNVFGTQTVAELSEKYRVKRFVLISTDKAVNPTSVMGATKRCCELLIQAMNAKSETEFVAVRFGNVLGSNGSVVPLFSKQIAEGGPVTITHPDIIRYFMTIPEAVRLVLTAGSMARGGEIFILDMGQPVRIEDLAKNMIHLADLEPGEDIDIVYTGLRPGEKLFEELLLSEEGIGSTAHEKIFVAAPIKIDPTQFWTELGHLNTAVQWGNRAASLNWLRKLVPTYHPSDDQAPEGQFEDVQQVQGEITCKASWKSM